MAVAPYDSLETVVTAARIRLNDSIASAGGEVLTDNASFTPQVVTNAWHRLQEFLAESNAARLINEVILSGLPVNVTADPGGNLLVSPPAPNAQLNWTGYSPKNDTLNVSFVLPQDMIFPLRLWERPHGQATEFVPMEYVTDGLSNQPQQGRNYQWEWRTDGIWMPGSNVSMDIKIRYAAFLPDFVPTGTTSYANQPVPIMRCLDSFAWYIASEMANARGDVDGAQFDTKAEAAATKIIERDTRQAALRSQWTIPEINPAPQGPYDTVNTVLNTVRARMNSAMKGAGDVIVAAQPFTQQTFNTGWRRLQAFLANLGHIRLTNEIIITGMPIVTSIDPSSQVYLSWFGFFDGTTLQTVPVLPNDLIFPLKIWERWTGVNAVFTGDGMENMLDGLVGGPKMTYNAQWEWRNDAVYMPGSTFSMDLRIRYAKYLPDFVEAGSRPWYLTPVPIANCLDALALYVCAEIALARPDLQLDPLLFKSGAEESAKLIFNRDVRAKQRVNVRRMSRSGRLEGFGEGSYGYCY